MVVGRLLAADLSAGVVQACEFVASVLNDRK